MPSTGPPAGSRRDPEIRALAGIGRAITSRLHIDDVLQAVVRQTTRLLRPRNWTLFLKDPSTGELVFTITVGRVSRRLVGRRIPAGEGIAGWIARTGRPALVRDATRDRRFSSRFDRTTGFRTGSILGAALEVRGEVLGVLELVRSKQEPAFTERELRLLQVICDFAAVALHNARNHSRVVELTRRDHLTVLYNSRHLHEVVRREVGRGRRTGRPVSVIFFDLDAFKEVVDRHGHQKAAAILTEVGSLVARSLGGSGIGFRYGGDEFTVVLPGQGAPGALRRARRLRRAVRSARFGGRLRIALTASFGVAAFPEHARSPRALVGRADEALYVAKALGKDKVALAGPARRHGASS